MQVQGVVCCNIWNMAHDNEDRSWMQLAHTDAAWQAGLGKFLEDTFGDTFAGATAPCPCKRCRRMAYLNRDAVELHLNSRGFDPYYIKQHHTGRSAKRLVVDDDDRGVCEVDDEGDHDDGVSSTNLLSSLISGAIHGEIKDGNIEEPNESARKIFKLMGEAEKELYPGCTEATQISFIVRLYQIKCMFGISNNGLEQILLLFCHLLPEGHCVPDILEKV